MIGAGEADLGGASARVVLADIEARGGEEAVSVSRLNLTSGPVIQSMPRRISTSPLPHTSSLTKSYRSQSASTVSLRVRNSTFPEASTNFSATPSTRSARRKIVPSWNGAATREDGGCRRGTPRRADRRRSQLRRRLQSGLRASPRPSRFPPASTARRRAATRTRPRAQGRRGSSGRRIDGSSCEDAEQPL